MKNETNYGFTLYVSLFFSLYLILCVVGPFIFIFCCFLFFENEGDFVSHCSSLCMIIIQYSVSYSVSSPVQLASGEDASYSLLS